MNRFLDPSIFLGMSRRPVLRRRMPKIGSALKRARIAAGLSRRDAARLVGIGRATLTRHEEDEFTPRHSALMRYLERLPGLTAHALLDRPPTTPPVAWPAAWRAMRDAQGWEADRLEWRVADGQVQVELVGLRALGVDMGLESVRLGLMRAACLAPMRPKVQGIELGQTEWLHEGLVHEFEWAPDGLTYRTTLPAERAAAVPMLDVPVRRLVLSAQQQDVELAAPVYRCWPNPIPEGDPSLERYLYPKGVEARIERDQAVVELQFPMPGLRHRLGWEMHGVEAPAAGGLGGTFRRARNLVGCSKREMGRQLGLSVGALTKAEARGSASPEVLERYCKVLPGAAPQDVLPAVPADVDLTHLECWEYYRQLYGFEARQTEKTIVFAEDGKSTGLNASHGLRPLHGRIKDLRVKRMLATVVLGEPGEGMQELAATEGTTIRRAGERGEHVLTFRRGRGEYRHEIVANGLRSAMTAEAARKREGELPCYSESESIVVTRPTRELVLRVEWPLGFRPADVKALAAPAAVPFADDLPTISTGSVKVSWRDSCASLTVKEPVVGVRYGLVWCLP